MAKGNLRNHRRTLSVLMALLLVGSAVTFQIGMKVYKDEQKIDASTRAHDKTLLNKSFNAATSFKTMYEIFTEWYVADYRYENPTSDKTDVEIMTGYTWPIQNEVLTMDSAAIFELGQEFVAISYDEKVNTLTPFVNTAAKNIWATYNDFDLDVKGITDDTEYNIVYGKASDYHALTFECSWAKVVNVAAGKDCLTKWMPTQAWEQSGTVDADVKIVQQEIQLTDIDPIEKAYFNIDMAKAVQRLNVNSTAKLNEFARLFRNGITTTLQQVNTPRKYMFVNHGGEFVGNLDNREKISKGDIKFVRRG